MQTKVNSLERVISVGRWGVGGGEYREEWGKREGNVTVAGRREMLVAKGHEGDSISH